MIFGRLTGSHVISTQRPQKNCVCGDPHEWVQHGVIPWAFTALPCTRTGCTIYEPDHDGQVS